jgi:hypothetical protein
MLLVFFLLACKQATSPPINEPPSPTPIEPGPAPSRSLPASEIMRMEGITSIHYTLYDSNAYAGAYHYHDSTFLPIAEFFLDSVDLREKEYYGDYRVTVYDLRKNVAWNYYAGQLTYLQLGDLNQVLGQAVQNCLGSWLQGPLSFVRTEYVDNKFCYVYNDSLGNQEWDWTEHRLPIQTRSTGIDLIYTLTTTTRLHIIDINKVFPDSLFQPPS